MHRFISSAASSSSGRAERPATTAAPSSSNRAELPSAERPATSTTPSTQLSITTIRGVQRWLAEDHVASCTSADAQRIREAVAVLSRPKPRQEDVRPLQGKWQVSQWHTASGKKPRPIPDVIQELQGKVIKAAQNLQQQLADSAEPTALDGKETDSADVQNDTAADEDPVLAHLRERHRKRVIEIETEQQRPLAKPKAAKKQNKRTASGSVEPPASKRQQGLTTASFASSVRDAALLQDIEDLGITGTAAQQRCRRVRTLQRELQKLKENPFIVGDQAKEIQ